MTQPKIEGSLEGIPRMFYGCDGTNWYAALIDSDGHLQIDVVTTALPTGAATAANQATMITALQLIDDLRAALDSVATDELDTHVEGFDPVPSSPVDTYVGASIPNAAETAVVSYTVTTGKTFYITDIMVFETTGAAGVEFWSQLLIAGAGKLGARVPAGNSLREHLNTPIKATSAQLVELSAYQWSGGAKSFYGNIIGFEV